MLKLTGINNLPLFTMGQVQINILGYPTILCIIPNRAPIGEDGVLGSEFFAENIVNIHYVSKYNVKNYKGKAYIKFANTNEILVRISIPPATLEDFEERDSQNITRQSRDLKNLSDDDLSNKILKIFLKTEIFFDNPCKFFNITDEERIESTKNFFVWIT